MMANHVLHAKILRQIGAMNSRRRAGIVRSPRQIGDFIEENLSLVVRNKFCTAIEAENVDLISLSNRPSLDKHILQLTAAPSSGIRDHKQKPSGICAFLENVQTKINRIARGA